MKPATETVRQSFERSFRRVADTVTIPRWLEPLAGHMYSYALGRGLLAYRPFIVSAEGWNERYQIGAWDHLGSIEEMSRLAVLGGYVRRFARAGTILDIGCGTGTLREYAEGTPFEGFVGIDVAPAAIEQARARWEHDARTVFEVADPVGYEHSGFEVIILSEVLYMVPDPGALLDSCRSRLLPHGVLLVSIWCHPGDDHVWKMIERRFRRLDRVQVIDEGYDRASHGWRVACYQHAPMETSSQTDARTGVDDIAG